MGTKTIEIKRKGEIYNVLVSEEDYPQLTQYKWYVGTSGGYAYRQDGRKTIYMHREIIALQYGDYPAKGRHTHHLNENPLDNRRENLRVVSPSENLRLKTENYRNNTTGHRHVYYDRSNGTYSAIVTLHKKRYRSARFATLEEAKAEARLIRFRLGIPRPEDTAGGE